jgi:hypothetical protein
VHHRRELSRRHSDDSYKLQRRSGDARGCKQCRRWTQERDEAIRNIKCLCFLILFDVASGPRQLRTAHTTAINRALVIYVSQPPKDHGASHAKPGDSSIVPGMLEAEHALPDAIHDTGSSGSKSQAKVGASILPETVQNIVPEKVERTVPNIIHNTGDKRMFEK